LTGFSSRCHARAPSKQAALQRALEKTLRMAQPRDNFTCAEMFASM
jgi:hypothetical protein